MSDSFYKAPIFNSSIPKRQPYLKDPTFLDEVSAAWQLEPIGQLYLDTSETYLSKPYDPPTNIEEQIENEPDLLQYREYFSDIRNQEHLDYLIEKIRKNNHNRSIRDNGGLIPEIVAALGDPITYTPIPFIKGVSLGRRFVKGAGLSMGITGAGEPIRHAYDPTATGYESAMYIGAAGVLGGGIIALFGRRGPRITGQGTPPETKAESVFKKNWDNENNSRTSDMYDQDTPTTYDVGGIENVVDDAEYKFDYSF